MLLAEPPETAYDLRFTLFGFPVRVAWTFWLGAIVFGHGLCQSFAYLSGSPVEEFGGGRLGMGPLLIVWTLCLLLSILIHELGHAFAFRHYGFQSSIVLYHFGGLAIPTSAYTPGRSAARMGEKEQLIVAFAGPAFQLISAFALILIVKMAGYQVAIFNNMPTFLHRTPWVGEGRMIDSEGLYALVSFYVFPSVLWALLNLVPVWPLDGGRIARSLIVLNGGTIAQSLWVSVICSAAMAFYAFNNGQPMMAIFFGMFAFSSYQMLGPMNNSWR
jgi:Zn-dependent protease